jgi:hypothetical protein
MNRKAVEIEFEMRSGGELSLGAWLDQQRAAGASLRRIADLLAERTGCRVSHEAVRLWMREG